MDASDRKFREILDCCVKLDASDVHITSGVAPYMRIRGEMRAVSEDVLTPFVVEQMAMGLMTDHQRQVFSEKHNLDFAFFAEDGTRFRGNIFRQRGTVAMAMRRLDSEFRSFDDLTLPPHLSRLAEYQNGLVIVTGPTGSGKSTTLATIINRINEQRPCHIITIEDPVEYVHRNKRSLIRQRELHCDVLSFGEALRAALREDPDVLLVGEMRDHETIRAAITAAETGHLVFSTLHTHDAVGAISRMISVCPPEEQQVVKHQLAYVLRATVSQRLLHRVGHPGQVPAVEIMFVTSAISNLIRTGELQQIYTLMQTGNNDGMLLLEQSLANLYAFGLIAREDALRLVRDENIFKARLDRLQQSRAIPQTV